MSENFGLKFKVKTEFRIVRHKNWVVGCMRNTRDHKWMSHYRD
jgi:hypothetical protein